MSIIKSDSLLSNIKNVSIRIDMKPNDGSNIFKSIMLNDHHHEKQIKLESLMDFDSSHIFRSDHHHQGNSLIDKLSVSKQIKDQNIPAYHYNWIVCKNNGMSEEEDNDAAEQQFQNPPQNERKFPQKLFEIKTDPKQVDRKLEQNHILSQDSENMNASQLSKKAKNETKNIPKNYGKAIICYIQKYKDKVLKITQKLNVDYHQLQQDLKRRKKEINTIADLRHLWSKYKFAKCMRVISYEFFRKHALSYIFDSRICTYSAHIKYRQRLSEAVENPDGFNHIKDY